MDGQYRYPNLDDSIAGWYGLYGREDRRLGIHRLNKIAPKLLDRFPTGNYGGAGRENTGFGGVDLIESGEIALAEDLCVEQIVCRRHGEFDVFERRSHRDTVHDSALSALHKTKPNCQRSIAFEWGGPRVGGGQPSSSSFGEGRRLAICSRMCRFTWSWNSRSWSSQRFWRASSEYFSERKRSAAMILRHSWVKRW